ncbi:hypothetical protein MNU24_07665 [Spiroplasma poulsonii]|nr:hypothetical protein [Spiroplasma poulsonii]UNF61779.1 hypothetical protein MNU24_07665 [Spiroplasma poulsonii]
MIILMMLKLLLLMLMKLQLNAQKKDKQSYSGKRKHTIKNTSNYRTRNQKNYCNKFFARKTYYALFKESKIPKIPN